MVYKFSFCTMLKWCTIVHNDSYIAPEAQTVSTSPAFPYPLADKELSEVCGIIKPGRRLK